MCINFITPLLSIIILSISIPIFILKNNLGLCCTCPSVPYSISLYLPRAPYPCKMSTSPVPCSRSWSISEDSLRRYVFYASENCIQELLSASADSSTKGGGMNNIDGFDHHSWKVLGMDNGVEISKRRSGSLHTFRSRWVLKSVSPQQFITVANAIDAAKQWDSDLVEARYIKELEENFSIIRLKFGDCAKPLFRNREFIVYERRQTMDDGTLVVAVASLPKEIASGLHPKQNNSIRALLLQSGWVVEKLDDDSCMVTYVVQLDPAGWLPKCFVNRLSTKLVMIIDNLRNQVLACPATTTASPTFHCGKSTKPLGVGDPYPRGFISYDVDVRGFSESIVRLQI